MSLLTDISAFCYRIWTNSTLHLLMTIGRYPQLHHGLLITTLGVLCLLMTLCHLAHLQYSLLKATPAVSIPIVQTAAEYHQQHEYVMS